MHKRAFIKTLVAAALVCAALPAQAEDKFITIASTTSTDQSGLFKHILPQFKAETGIEVRVVAVGTGQALKIGMQGDADALLVHDRKGEDKFVAEGFGIDRRDVMYNDFVIIGPKSDPAAVKGMTDAVGAFKKIAAAKAPFASRGDDSGTNRAELRFWTAAGVDVKSGADWYKALGQGMGPTLNAAAAMNAYVMSDRATWANFKNPQDLAILAQGDKALFNPYGSILVDPAKRPVDKAALAKVWHDWLTGPKGAASIASFKINGEQLFFPQGKIGG